MFNPRVVEHLRRQVFDFCQATLDTIRGDVEQAMTDVRFRLGVGLEEGESYRKLTRRIRGIIRDPYRAARVASTEAARAMHGGQLVFAKETGVVKAKRWLASSDACAVCQSIARQGAVGLDEPFYVHASGAAAYRAVLHPPAHPFCMCAMTEVI